MATIYLVSCVSKKQSTETEAEKLYISDWFKKAKAYIKSNTNYWFILSAKYGLIHPSTIIQPYELTLNRMPKTDRLQWSKKVLGKLKLTTSPGDHIVFLGGGRYREFLVPELYRLNYSIEVPLAHMGIGQQLSWLKNNTTSV